MLRAIRRSVLIFILILAVLQPVSASSASADRLPAPAAPTATAATAFTVTATADQPDATPGDGICRASGGQCTLRAAIQEANALASSDTIHLPAGTYTLTAGALPVTTSMQIIGADPATTIINGANASRVIMVDGMMSGGLTFRLQNLTITGGRELHGAGLAMASLSGTVALENCIFRNNIATGYGGAINIGDISRLTLLNTIVRDNQAAGGGGGIHSEGAMVTIINSTLSANQAGQTGGGISSVIGSEGQVRLYNSTVSGNTAAQGAGIASQRNGLTYLYHTTVTANTATVSGGGLGVYPFVDVDDTILPGGTISIENSIVAGNAAPAAPDLFDAVVSTGYNLIGSTAGWSGTPASTDLTNQAPLLGPLAANGGFTPTHALLPGSPAIDHAQPGSTATGLYTRPSTNDQRGQPRPADGDANGDSGSDIGAYEAAEIVAPLQPLDQRGGAIQTFAIEGATAYLGIHTRLEVVSLFDLSAPWLRGRLTFYPEQIVDLAVKAAYVYTVFDSGVLRVIDASNPAAPFVISEIDTGLPPEYICLYGSSLYVVSGPLLRVFDVSNPLDPKPQGAYATPNRITDLVFNDGAAWAGSERNFTILDVANPAFPAAMQITKGGSDGFMNVTSMALSANNGFMVSPDGKLGNFNITPTNQVWIHIKQLFPQNSPPPAQVVYDTNRLYITRDTGMYPLGDIQIVDVADPANPAVIGAFTQTGFVNHLEVIDHIAYLADYTTGLRIVNFADPAHPVLIGEYRVPWYYTLDVSQGQALANAEAGALELLGLSGGRPATDAYLPTALPQTPAYFHDGTAYVISGASIQLYAASPLTGIQPLGSYDLPETVCDVVDAAFSGSRMFLAESDCGKGVAPGGLRVLDISDPSHLSEAGHYAMTTQAGGVAVSGSTAYVTEVGFGLRVLDVSNPAAITQIGSLSYTIPSIPEFVGPIAVSGSTAYMMKGLPNWGGQMVRVIDLSNPAAPVETGALGPLPGNIFSLHADNGYLLLGRGFWGLTVYDLADPAHPLLAGQHPSYFSTLSARQVGNFIYTADRRGGLLTYALPRRSVAQDGQPTQVTSPSQDVAAAFPAGALASGATLTYAALLGPTQPFPGAAVASFQLTAAEADGDPLTVLSQSATVTIHYDPLWLPGSGPHLARLYLWDATSQSWQDAAESCSPASAYQVDTDAHTISVDICHLTEFTLAWPGEPSIRLPEMLRGFIFID